MNTLADMVRDIVREPYAWQGAYEKVALMDDGGCVCGKCVRENCKLILLSTMTDCRDGWTLQGVFLAEETEETLYCDHCGRVIVEWEAQA